MARRILIILGHSDPWPECFCQALPATYHQGASGEDHEVKAGRLAIVLPIWLGTMLALLKALFEPVLRHGFAIEQTSPDRWQSHFDAATRERSLAEFARRDD